MRHCVSHVDLFGHLMVNSSEQAANWDAMPLVKDNNSTYTIGATFVSDLMIDVGYRVNSEYGVDATSTIADNMNVFGQYGLTSVDGGANHFSKEQIAYEIRNERPVVMMGYRYDSDGVEHGHAWVIDGQTDISCLYTNEYIWRRTDCVDWTGNDIAYTLVQVESIDFGEDYPEEGKHVVKNVSLLADRYFQMNWGWNGVANDDHYCLDFLTGWLADGKNYNHNPRIIYGIHD